MEQQKVKAETKALKVADKKVINKGTGAGGANTNKTGKPFEENTNNIKRMLDYGFEKQKAWITKTFEDKTVISLKNKK